MPPLKVKVPMVWALAYAAFSALKVNVAVFMFNAVVVANRRLVLPEVDVTALLSMVIAPPANRLNTLLLLNIGAPPA